MTPRDSLEDVLVVIPARSGSKSLPNKNIRMLGGKPLLIHSFIYASKSIVDLERVVLSTDSKLYADIAVSHGMSIDSIRIRPSCLSEDCVKDYPVAIDALAWAEEKTKRTFEYIVWLRPTSPLRSEGLIEESIRLLESVKGSTSVRAVRRVSEHPYRIWKHDNNFIRPIVSDIYEPGNIPRQELCSDYFYQSGEIEVVRRRTLIQGSMSGDAVLPLIMKELTPDIDQIDDFKAADRLWIGKQS